MRIVELQVKYVYVCLCVRHHQRQAENNRNNQHVTDDLTRRCTRLHFLDRGSVMK